VADGGDGNDILSTVTGNLLGGRGDDLLTILGEGTLDAGEGNDLAHVATGFDGDHGVADGGVGIDTVDLLAGRFALYATGQAADPNLGPSVLSLVNFEAVTVGKGDQWLDDYSAQQSLDLGKGNDRLVVHSQHGTYFLGNGQDQVGFAVSLTGQIPDNANFNTAYGGNGDDIISMDTWYCEAYGGAGNDIASITGFSNIYDAGSGDDTLYLAGPTKVSNNKSIHMGIGNDTVNANGGFSSVDLDDGDDVFSFAVVNFETTRAIGTIRGGAGADQFDFTGNGGHATIGDFDVAVDRIGINNVTRLADIDSITQTATGVILQDKKFVITLDLVQIADLSDANILL
jgi:Ca2+-binding RTX toxin-like protein